MPTAATSFTALAYFVRIVEAGSFTAAARALQIKQPSLSLAIRKLEETLETQLLLRTRKGVTVTAAGQVLLHHARNAFRSLEQAEAEIHELHTELRGQFTIGCHESLAAYFLPRFMARFFDRYPEIRVSMRNGNSVDVERAVIEREIDVGLVVNARRHADAVIQPLFSDRVEFMMSSARRRRRSSGLPELLEAAPLIYVAELPQVQYLLAALTQAGYAPSQRLECSSLELVKSLVLDGVGVGILPHRVATHGVARGRLELVSPSLPHYDDTIALMRRYDIQQTRALKQLVDELRGHAQSMAALPAREQ